MATGWASPTKKNLNFARLCRLLIDGGTHVLRHVFDTIHSPSTLHTVLHSTPVHALLQGLRRRGVLTVHQWDKLYPRTTPVTSGGFDITLLFVLLRNICNLTPPPTGWDKPPAASDLSKEADMARIKLYRNELYGHITETAVSDADFEKLWTEISVVLIRFGGPHHKPDIDRLKVEPMDIDDQKHFIKALEDTEKSIKTAIEIQKQRLMGKLEDIDRKLDLTEYKEKTIKDSEQQVIGKLEDMEGKLDFTGYKERTIKDSEQQVIWKLQDMEGKLDFTGYKEKTIKDSEQQVIWKLEDMEGKLDDAIKDAIKDTKVTVRDSAQSNVENLTDQPAAEKDDLSSRAQDYTRKLKLSITRQTESLPVLEVSALMMSSPMLPSNVSRKTKKKQNLMENRLMTLKQVPL